MKKKNFIKWGVVAVIAVLLVVFVVNRDYLADLFRGMIYKPSEEMLDIRENLALTGKGSFIFNASQPVLSGRAEFNAACRKNGDETAILGCYTDGNVFVYDIDSEELKGIKELTAAHELLHAVWARMGDGEQKQYAKALNEVLENNRDVLVEEISYYDNIEKQDELYVRAGTEIKKLPDALEKHFGEIFKDQDKIVDYYNSYIGVFNNLKAEMNALTVEMETIQAQIDTKTTEYTGGVDALNAEIKEFNECAETAGCFNSQWAFNTRRAALLREQESLEYIYNEIDGLINKYNELVEKYNADIVYSDKLNQKINSSVKPAEIE